ncbi:epidermal growth factor receptor kinase substrate 8-like protein 1 isoform X2 [Frieseomelitta varia]|uniref:epidermal growth factor receptor kinase substrate 8-like protein 1 isoform X2 n=1 Tax=Frieseomelitta varia TaxID=561572 RepID=UPI001CB67D06|nr:epidermal growth factor receptor kinase substrate 8-like protein 1 isoform X2 [Frieseomelitta varia]
MNGNEEELSIDESATNDQKLKPNELTEVVQVHPPPSDTNDGISPETPTPSTPTPSLTTSSAPPPPPPPPLDTQISVSSITSTMSTVTLKRKNNEKQVQEELKQVLTIFREKKQHYGINREPLLDHCSTPREVQRWLSAKRFSEKTCKQLRDMTGSEVFNLTRRQLEQYCGVAEGSKLYSEISTARIESEKSPRMSELKQILAKARHRVEE